MGAGGPGSRAQIAPRPDALDAPRSPHHEVVGVVRGRDLDRAGTEGHVHQLGVADDRDAAPADGVHHVLAVEVLVAGGEGGEGGGQSGRLRGAGHCSLGSRRWSPTLGPPRPALPPRHAPRPAPAPAPRVLGVHRDGGVAEHRLGARRGHHDLAVAAL
jgi:hypothetical protein